jgi:hypothetical protein
MEIKKICKDSSGDLEYILVKLLSTAAAVF